MVAGKKAQDNRWARFGAAVTMVNMTAVSSECLVIDMEHCGEMLNAQCSPARCFSFNQHRNLQWQLVKTDDCWSNCNRQHANHFQICRLLVWPIAQMIGRKATHTLSECRRISNAKENNFSHLQYKWNGMNASEKINNILTLKQSGIESRSVSYPIEWGKEKRKAAIAIVWILKVAFYLSFSFDFDLGKMVRSKLVFGFTVDDFTVKETKANFKVDNEKICPIYQFPR